MVGVVPVEEAQQMAREAGVDLVEVSPNADPPVCKILDYGKFKYEQQKRDHDARKRQRGGELKEVRFRPKTDTHDRQIKLDRARAFLEDGHRVQFTMMFRGREMQHRELGTEFLKEVVKGFEDVAKVESSLRSEGRRMHILLMPKPGAKPKDRKSDSAKEDKTPMDQESDSAKEDKTPKDQESDSAKEDETPVDAGE
jgi:translation initiation factor IF-3